MALFNTFRVIQVSLSSRCLLTQKEKEVVRDFVSKAEKEAHCVHSQNAIFNSAYKKPVIFS